MPAPNYWPELIVDHVYVYNMFSNESYLINKWRKENKNYKNNHVLHKLSQQISLTEMILRTGTRKIFLNMISAYIGNIWLRYLKR